MSVWTHARAPPDASMSRAPACAASEARRTGSRLNSVAIWRASAMDDGGLVWIVGAPARRAAWSVWLATLCAAPVRVRAEYARRSWAAGIVGAGAAVAVAVTATESDCGMAVYLPKVSVVA